MPGEAALMPMDGYHFDNAMLVERGLLPRKGAPQTFDVDGLARDLGAAPRRRAARSSSRSSTAPSTWRAPGRGSIRPEHRRDRDRGQLSAARPAALERARAASSTARSFSRSTGTSCAGGLSTAGWRTAWTPPPPLPAPRGTTCPTPKLVGGCVRGRPTCSGGTEKDLRSRRVTASGDHLLNVARPAARDFRLRPEKVRSRQEKQ